MKRHQILESIRQNINFPYLYLGGGGAMVIHGAKEETPDVDIVVSAVVSADDFAILRIGRAMITPTRFELVRSIDIYQETMAHLNPSPTWIEGVKVASLTYLLSVKILWGREKDLVDVRAILRVLRTRS